MLFRSPNVCEVEEHFVITGSVANAEWMEFTLGTDFSFTRRFPLVRIMKDFWLSFFRSSRCFGERWFSLPMNNHGGGGKICGENRKGYRTAKRLSSYSMVTKIISSSSPKFSPLCATLAAAMVTVFGMPPIMNCTQSNS